MVQVTKLARAVLGVRDLNRSAAFYTDDWGLGVTEEAPKGIFLRTAGGEHHSIGLVQDEANGLIEVGYEVGTADDLERAAEELTRDGVVIEKAPGPSDRPGVRRNMRLRDPDGRLVEIMELRDHPWFLGTQFHPEFRSRPDDPHPLFVSFLAACKVQRRHTEALGYPLEAREVGAVELV